jgi:hypothetical protein
MRRQMIPLISLAAVSLAGTVLAQEQMMKVKGGHELGEAAEQFFADGREKDVLNRYEYRPVPFRKAEAV